MKEEVIADHSNSNFLQSISIIIDLKIVKREGDDGIYCGYMHSPTIDVD